MASLKPTQLILKPQTFEIPGFRQEFPFVGREWFFPELERCYSKDNNSPEKLRGVALLGDIGMGKSYIIGRMVALSTLSCFLVNSPNLNRLSTGIFTNILFLICLRLFFIIICCVCTEETLILSTLCNCIHLKLGRNHWKKVNLYILVLGNCKQHGNKVKQFFKEARSSHIRKNIFQIEFFDWFKFYLQTRYHPIRRRVIRLWYAYTCNVSMHGPYIQYSTLQGDVI